MTPTSNLLEFVFFFYATIEWIFPQTFYISFEMLSLSEIFTGNLGVRLSSVQEQSSVYLLPVREQWKLQSAVVLAQQHLHVQS